MTVRCTINCAVPRDVCTVYMVQDKSTVVLYMIYTFLTTYIT